MKKYALIVAGGSGKRMGTSIPKQFLTLAGKPLLIHTINKFKEYDPDIEIILVLPQVQIIYWKQLCKNHNFYVDHQVVSGGDKRFYSVQNGLKQIDGDALVAIHDGVRPLVSINTIARTFNRAGKDGAAIPVMPLKDSIRKVGESGSTAVDRENYKLVQTPQCFLYSVLQEAYNQEFKDTFTDDASVVETLGHQVHLVDGNRENLKITTPEDLVVAEALIANQ